MLVAVVVGREARLCGCESWLAHWQQHAGRVGRVACAAAGCRDAAREGAHVRRVDAIAGVTGIDYIVPLCGSHSAQASPFALADDAHPVPASAQRTCGNA